MPWRGIFVVAAGLLAGGCILSAYQVASWTMSGVSYVFSGKGLGDHALSLATSKDCATLRIFQDKQICVDYGSDFENGWVALASSWKVPDILRQTDDTVDTADTDRAGIPAVQSAFSADAAGGELPLLASAGFTPALDFGGLIPGNGGAGRIYVAAATLGRPAIYLVLGSFRNRDNANALRTRHAARNSLVIKLRADDRTTFRVLVGPIAATFLTKARTDIAKAGIRNAWAVRLCGGSFTPPPCEPVLQQASLPAL